MSAEVASRTVKPDIHDATSWVVVGVGVDVGLDGGLKTKLRSLLMAAKSPPQRAGKEAVHKTEATK
jgi:hypothetical protein